MCVFLVFFVCGVNLLPFDFRKIDFKAVFLAAERFWAIFDGHKSDKLLAGRRNFRYSGGSLNQKYVKGK